MLSLFVHIYTYFEYIHLLLITSLCLMFYLQVLFTFLLRFHIINYSFCTEKRVRYSVIHSCYAGYKQLRNMAQKILTSSKQMVFTHEFYILSVAEYINK